MAFDLGLGKKEDTLMETMLRALSEGGWGAFGEALSLLASAHGDGAVISIVRVSDRKVIATSETDAGASLDAFVGTVTYLDRECHYYRRDRTNVVFRSGVECVFVHPLAFGGETMAAVIEARDHSKPLGRRYFDLIAVAAAGFSVYRNASREFEGDGLFGDALDCEEAMGEDKSVAVFGIPNGTTEDVLRLAKTLSDGGERPYRVGRNSFAVLLDGGVIDFAEAANAWLDACYEEGLTDARIGCAPCGKDPSLALYLARKGCGEAGRGEIRFMGSGDAPAEAVSGRTVVETVVEGARAVGPKEAEDDAEAEE